VTGFLVPQPSTVSETTVMKYSSYHPAAVDPEADSEEEEEDDSDDRCCGMREHLPHWSCCMWFFIVVIAAMLVSEVLAWLRQPSCGHSHFEWNQVIPANTVNQIERGNLGSMLQEYDILGLWTKLWHFDVYENATALSAEHVERQSKVFRGSWSNGHLLFGFLEKMAYIDETFGPNKLVALEGRKMWGTLGSSFQLWLCSESAEHSYDISVDSDPWDFAVVYNIHRMPGSVLVAQTRFKLMDVGFWSDESHWEATVTSTGPNDNDTDTEVIGTVRQNISSFNSKWFVVNKRPDLLPNEVLSFMTLVYDIDETRQS